MKKIEVFLCFDHNYVLPAAVSIHSMLSYANVARTYVIHIVAPDLTSEDAGLLSRMVGRFSNAQIVFEPIPQLPFDVSGILRHTHFSSSLFYKLLVPRMAQSAEYAIIADVDTVYNDDIAFIADEMSRQKDICLMGAWDMCYMRWHRQGLVPDGKVCLQEYDEKWTADEREKLIVNAGLMILRPRLINERGDVEKWLQAVGDNLQRLVLPEQDVMNLTCAPLVRPLSWRSMAYSYAYSTYVQLTEEEKSANPVWDEMFKNPIQIHYAARDKPWQFPNVPMGERWFEACAQAGLMADWCAWYGDFTKEMVGFHNRRKLIDWSIDVCKRHYDISISQRVWRNPHSLLKSIRKDQ